MTATTGPTSETDEPTISHTARLVETHRIMLDPRTLPGGSAAALDVARLHAEAYARARGFEIIGMSGVTTIDPPATGVQFTVTVGSGDIALDQRTPGVLDRWRWSGGAFDWWRNVLNRNDGREGRLLTLIDDNGRRRQGRITGIRPGPIPGTASLEGEFTDGLTPNGFHGFGSPRDGDPSWMTPGALPTAVDRQPPWAKRSDPDFEDDQP